VDNETTGLAAYVDQQFAAARGDGVSGSTPDAEVEAEPADQETVAPNPDDANDALSGDDVDPDAETATALDAEETPAQPDPAALSQELEQLRADKAARDAQEAEWHRQNARAEAQRQAQETIAYFERQFATFDEIEDGLGMRVQQLAAQIANTALSEEQANTARLQQEADANGRIASAMLQVLQAQAPEVFAANKPLMQAVMALNSPEEQGRYLQTIKSHSQANTAKKDAEIKALKDKIKNLTLQSQARGLAADDALVAGSGGNGIAPPLAQEAEPAGQSSAGRIAPRTNKP
jgi:hypothetical protein